MNSINFVLDNFKGKRRDRALGILTGSIKENSEELISYFKCELIRVRRLAIKNFKVLEELYKIRYETSKTYKAFEKSGDIVRTAEIQLNLSKIDSIIKETKNIISELGETFINFLTADILTEHEACQIFNINFKTWQDNKKRYLKDCSGKDSKHLVYKIISVTGVEYRERKGNLKECYDCDKHEMPVYWAISERILSELENNVEMKKAARKKIDELFPEIRKYRAVKDLEGNIVRMEEIKEDDLS